MHQREIAVYQQVLHIEMRAGLGKLWSQHLHSDFRAIRQARIMLNIIRRDMGCEGSSDISLRVEAIDEISDDGTVIDRLRQYGRCDGDERDAQCCDNTPHSAPSFIRDTAWSQARAVSAI
eukprot:TRINITY_DN20661_c0_g1_i4.p2 TRINITY_DN20661_c0_g1~~TRINITY_DN20661_c0_g1_i4.p2  ORF type:complete len:120 (+),score=7.83 TRINITY_DN20661_c0_g1_i4:169-528(+)